MKYVIILYTALKPVKTAKEIFYSSLPTAVISTDNPSINSHLWLYYEENVLNLKPDRINVYYEVLSFVGKG